MPDFSHMVPLAAPGDMAHMPLPHGTTAILGHDRSTVWSHTTVQRNGVYQQAITPPSNMRVKQNNIDHTPQFFKIVLASGKSASIIHNFHISMNNFNTKETSAN